MAHYLIELPEDVSETALIQASAYLADSVDLRIGIIEV